jgi:glutamate-ammonia-ligase adenylyltransferase
MRPEFSSVPFQDAAKAEANLARLEQALAPSLLAPLASLLAQSPDPDGALNLLERYAANAPPPLLAEIPRNPTALTYLVAIFGHSRFLAETFLAEPALPLQFARDRNFTKLKSKEDLMQDFARFSITSPDHWLSAQLARFKRRNYLRIVLKDVLKISTLGEVTAELSMLADIILANTLIFCDQELEKRYGQPQARDAQGRIVRAGFSIVSLGKLGGNELNYSSDIDLLFLYSQDGETAGGSEPDSVISNKEYFVRLAHAITRTITQSTPHGSVFRVDVRLRPEGDQGDLAISLKSSLEYYEHRARDWELQMLIKARHSAGDARLTRKFLRGVERYIYGSPTDFAAIESVMMSRERMSQKLREGHDESLDVKLHRGGIRDIEFLTQCLQRLHGGRDPWVRSGGTLFALRKLNDKGCLSDRDFAALTAAYEFLRKVEHRIQLKMGHQTHRLPDDPATLDHLARRVGVEAGPGRTPSQTLLRALEECMESVAEIYQRVIHPRAATSAEAAFDLEPVPAVLGEHAPSSWDGTLAFLSAQAPGLAAAARAFDSSERGRRHATRFLGALLASSDRFALARENPESLRRALEVVAASDYLGDLLVHHPEDMVALNTSDVAHATDRDGQILLGLDAAYENPPFPWGLEEALGVREKMALMRRHFRARVIELGAADLTELGAIFPALARWSSLAARSIATALVVALQALERPCGELPFAVLALGRLGLKEFDLSSDADLVFVVASGTPREEMDAWRRLAEKTIEVLASYTRDGTLFAVDTRLRPRGQEGELVVSEDALLGYLADAAHVWEALTYLKCFPVAGNIEFGRRLTQGIAETVFDRFSTAPDLEAEMQEMRRRLEREVSVPSTNTKTVPGGYYDVDFTVSLLRLRHRVGAAPGAQMADQIAALANAGLLSCEDVARLREGAAFLRSVDHAVRLVTGKAAAGLPEVVAQAELVERLARRWGVIEGQETMASRLRAVQREVRYVYRRVLGAE